MNPTNSALHRTLGLPQRPINYDDVATAASAGFPETGELDWKAELPKFNGGPSEFAKDVTALANAAGGTLIYGVTNSGHLKGLPTETLDADVARLQQQLASRVRPYLIGIEYQVVSGDDKVLLIVHVPPSAAAPHLVYEQKADTDGKRPSVVPLRVNDQTEWMDERQLAEAYRRRFEIGENRRHRLMDLAEFAADQMNISADESTWLTFVATPALTEIMQPIERHELLNLETASLRLGAGVFNSVAGFGTVLGVLPHSAISDPRVGLRSWVASNTVADADRNEQRPTYLEVHHDGSIVLAVDAGWDVKADSAVDEAKVSSRLVDEATVEFIALASVVAARQAPNSELLLRAAITANGTSSYVAIDTSGNGNFRRRWSRKIPRVRPVLGVLTAHPEEFDLKLAAYELASGVIHQFGLDTYVPRPVNHGNS